MYISLMATLFFLLGTAATGVVLETVFHEKSEEDKKIELIAEQVFKRTKKNCAEVDAKFGEGFFDDLSSGKITHEDCKKRGIDFMEPSSEFDDEEMFDWILENVSLMPLDGTKDERG